MGEKFGRGAAAEFLKGFGEFTRDADGSAGDDFHESDEGFFQPMGRLEKNSGFIAGRGLGEFAGAASAFDRKESAEEKPVARKARSDEGREDGGGARQNRDGQAALDAGLDEAVAGIGNARHAGIGDQGDMGTLGDAVGEFPAAGGFIVAVEADEGFFDAEVLEKQSAVAGILGGDEIGGLESFNRAEGYVLTVADGGWNDAQHGERGGITSLL